MWPAVLHRSPARRCESWPRNRRTCWIVCHRRASCWRSRRFGHSPIAGIAASSRPACGRFSTSCEATSNAGRAMSICRRSVNWPNEPPDTWSRCSSRPCDPTINATGRFFGPEFGGLAAGGRRARSHGLRSAAASCRGPRRIRDAAAVLCRLTGAEAATVVSSYAGAVWLAAGDASRRAGGKEVIVARGEVGDVDSNCSLATMAKSAGAALREVGSVNRVSAADYEAAVVARNCSHRACRDRRLSRRRRLRSSRIGIARRPGTRPRIAARRTCWALRHW